MPYHNDDLEMPEDLEDIEILPIGDFNIEKGGRREQFQQRQDHQIEESGPLVLENRHPHAYPVEESGPMIPEGFREPQPMPREQSGPLVLHQAMDQHQFPIQHHHQHHHYQNPPMLPREMPGTPQNLQNFPPQTFHPFQPFQHHSEFNEFDHHQLRHQIFLEIKADFDRKTKEKDQHFKKKLEDANRLVAEKDKIIEKLNTENSRLQNQVREQGEGIQLLEKQLRAHVSFPDTPREHGSFLLNRRDLPSTSDAQPIHYDSEAEIPERGFLSQIDAKWFLQRTFGGRPWRFKIQDDTTYLFDPSYFGHIKQDKRKVSGAAHIYRSAMRGIDAHVLWKDLQEDERKVWNELHSCLSIRQQREIEKGLIKIKERSTVIKREPSDDGYERAANGTAQHWQVQQVPVAMPYAPGPPYLGYHQPGMPMPPQHPMWHVPPQDQHQFQGSQNGWMGGPIMHFQMPQGAMHGQMPMDMQHRMPTEPMQAAPVPRREVHIKEEIIDVDD
ncbi:hypothetical protein B9Z55_007273 [Caenorhabditis nigoni]|uniref:Uncharacterized protein n=1 Tax=Caenorhabditis nigoni TaxID=1611254 RepID=A0A2G5V8U9_9PELO|nr:hypothetical protein B9Z55_007273 [Caenorhabditis nigoni]